MRSDADSLLKRKKPWVREPWDLCRGLDVFRMRSELDNEVDLASFTHWAPNCNTFSMARSQPYSWCPKPPKPVRSVSEPEGIRKVSQKLPKAKRRRIEKDTEMADLAALNCAKALSAGKGFGLEHPLNSLARRLPSWKELENLPGVFCTEDHACMFHSSRRRKYHKF